MARLERSYRELAALVPIFLRAGDRDLCDGVSGTRASRAFDVVRRAIAKDTLLTLCSIFEPSGRDRACIERIVTLARRADVRSTLVEMLDSERPQLDFPLTTDRTHVDALTRAISNWGNLTADPAFASKRRSLLQLRNREAAHALVLDEPYTEPLVSFAREFKDHARPIVVDLAHGLRGNRPDEALAVYERPLDLRARVFWKAVQLGVAVDEEQGAGGA